MSDLKRREMREKRTWFYICAAVLVILRLPALLYPVLDVDESIYGLFARIWFDGGTPYVDCVETKPLGIYLFYGVIFSIFGKFNMIAVHAATIAVVGATAYVIGLVASRLYSPRAGFWAALLYIVFGTTYIPKYIATTIEPIMLLAVALQFHLWIKFERDRKGWMAFASGIAFSTACLFKYQAGMNIVVMLVYIVIVKWAVLKDVPFWAYWRGFARFLVGASILPLAMLAYLKHIGAIDAFWLWNIGGSLNYLNEGSSSIGLAHQILVRVLPYIASTLLIWIVALVRSVSLFRKGRTSRIDSAHEHLILLWFVLSIVPVSVGHRFYGHYFLLLLPPMAILGSKIMSDLWDRPNAKWLQFATLFWILLPTIGFTAARFFISDIHTKVGEDNLDNYKPIAAYVASHTAPSDRIIAWGYAPLVYWYSERLPAMRFFWSDLLTGRVPGSKADPSSAGEFVDEKAWDMFMADLERYRPIYIIDTAVAGLHDYKDYPISKYPRLVEYMSRQYRQETSVNGAIFYRRVE